MTRCGCRYECGAGGRLLRCVSSTLVALGIAVVPVEPGLAAPRASNGAVAARIAGELGCEAFAYRPGPNEASSSDGRLSCETGAQDFTVYVFATNRARDRGVAHVRLWSGPDEVYHFVRDNRAVIAPQSASPWPAYTRRWAAEAARRTGGVVFSG